MSAIDALRQHIETTFEVSVAEDPRVSKAWKALEANPGDKSVRTKFVQEMSAISGQDFGKSDFVWRRFVRDAKRFAATAAAASSTPSDSVERASPLRSRVAKWILAQTKTQGIHPKDLVPMEWQAFAENPESEGAYIRLYAALLLHHDIRLPVEEFGIRPSVEDRALRYRDRLLLDTYRERDPRLAMPRLGRAIYEYVMNVETHISVMLLNLYGDDPASPKARKREYIDRLDAWLRDTHPQIVEDAQNWMLENSNMTPDEIETRYLEWSLAEYYLFMLERGYFVDATTLYVFGQDIFKMVDTIAEVSAEEPLWLSVPLGADFRPYLIPVSREVAESLGFITPDQRREMLAVASAEKEIEEVTLNEGLIEEVDEELYYSLYHLPAPIERFGEILINMIRLNNDVLELFYNLGELPDEDEFAIQEMHGAIDEKVVAMLGKARAVLGREGRHIEFAMNEETALDSDMLLEHLKVVSAAIGAHYLLLIGHDRLAEARELMNISGGSGYMFKLITEGVRIVGGEELVDVIVYDHLGRPRVLAVPESMKTLEEGSQLYRYVLPDSLRPFGYDPGLIWHDLIGLDVARLASARLGEILVKKEMAIRKKDEAGEASDANENRQFAVSKLAYIQAHDEIAAGLGKQAVPDGVVEIISRLDYYLQLVADGHYEEAREVMGAVGEVGLRIAAAMRYESPLMYDMETGLLLLRGDWTTGYQRDFEASSGIELTALNDVPLEQVPVDVRIGRVYFVVALSRWINENPMFALASAGRFGTVDPETVTFFFDRVGMSENGAIRTMLSENSALLAMIRKLDPSMEGKPHIVVMERAEQALDAYWEFLELHGGSEQAAFERAQLERMTEGRRFLVDFAGKAAAILSRLEIGAIVDEADEENPEASVADEEIELVDIRSGGQVIEPVIDQEQVERDLATGQLKPHEPSVDEKPDDEGYTVLNEDDLKDIPSFINDTEPEQLDIPGIEPDPYVEKLTENGGIVSIHRIVDSSVAAASVLNRVPLFGSLMSSVSNFAGINSKFTGHLYRKGFYHNPSAGMQNMKHIGAAAGMAAGLGASLLVLN